MDIYRRSFSGNMHFNSTLIEHVIQPTQIKFPFYHLHRTEVVPGLSDALLAVVVPLLAYWLVSVLFTSLDFFQLPWIEKYRIHEPEEVQARNRVTPAQVVKAVVLQQLVQTALGVAYLDSEPSNVLVRDYLDEMKPYTLFTSVMIQILFPSKHAHYILANYGQSIVQWTYWWGLPILQFLWASFVLDTWQYFWHRAFHTNKFLYKHIHSIHHRLYCPYSFGALYNHPVEGFILDSLGAVIAHWASGMSVRQATLLFGLSTAKTVDDHCGLALPFDPLQHLFGNNAAYHDIHHQQFGIKSNFSQPYFIHWDVLMGTRMTIHEAKSKHRPRTTKSNPNTSSISSLNPGLIVDSDDSENDANSFKALKSQ